MSCHIAIRYIMLELIAIEYFKFKNLNMFSTSKA